MAVLATNLGFPRIGPYRELKKSPEAYWAGRASATDLQASARPAGAWDLPGRGPRLTWPTGG